MVTKRTTIGIIGATVLVAGSAMAWVYIVPSISDHPVPAQHVILSAALNLYRTRHGSEPASLVALQPALDEFTNSRCSIVRLGKDHYRVWLYLNGKRTHQFEVDYKLGKDGFRETCHVHKIREFHHRK